MRNAPDAEERRPGRNEENRSTPWVHILYLRHEFLVISGLLTIKTVRTVTYLHLGFVERGNIYGMECIMR